MKTSVREKKGTFSVPIEIEADGVRVPPGTYAGKKKELGVTVMGKLSWQSPEYLMVIPQPPGGTFLELEVGVTAQVNDGTITFS